MRAPIAIAISMFAIGYGLLAHGQPDDEAAHALHWTVTIERHGRETDEHVVPAERGTLRFGGWACSYSEPQVELLGSTFRRTSRELRCLRRGVGAAVIVVCNTSREGNLPRTERGSMILVQPGQRDVGVTLACSPVHGLPPAPDR